MNKITYKKLLPLAVVPVLLVAGCNKSSDSAAKASASAFATSSTGRYDKAQADKLVKKCFPASEATQLKMLEPKKGKPERTKVEDCLAIPETNRTAFDDALLNALLHGNIKSHAGRTTLTEVTIPQLVVKYQ